MIRSIFPDHELISNLELHSENLQSKLPADDNNNNQPSLWQIPEHRDSNEDSKQFEERRSTFHSFE